MSATTGGTFEALRGQIDESFRRAAAQQQRLTQADRRYNTIQTTLSGLATLIAGVVSAVGAAPGGNWRAVCGIAATCAFGATIAAVTQKQRTDPVLIAQTSECVGKLRSLRVAALDPNTDPNDLSGQYRKVLTEYERVDC